jgi:hypothetical protein
MEPILIDKIKEVEQDVSHLNFKQLKTYLINRFNLKRIKIESILLNNKRIISNDFKYNHLIYIIAVLLLDKQNEYLELSLVPKDQEDIEHVEVFIYVDDEK